MDEKREQPLDEPLRESDVTAGDRLDDRVSEGEGLPGPVGDGEPYPEIKPAGGSDVE